METSNLFIAGFIAHIIGDFMLQNEWMATYKTSLLHPASWVHSGIHFIVLLFVFSPFLALLLAISHLLIDTRVPLREWRRFYKQTNDPKNPAFISFAMWQDQVLHLLCIYFAAWIVTR